MQIEKLLCILLEVCGWSMISLALVHFWLPKQLRWHDDLDKLAPINSQIFIAHTAFIAIGILLLGLVCAVFPLAFLQRTQLGMVAAACFSMCWISRLVLQFTLFTGDITLSRRFDLFLRICGTLLWAFYSSIFSLLFAFQAGLVNG